MKLLFSLLIFSLFSCSSTINREYCTNIDSFNFIISKSNIDKINEKLVLNELINNSNINYDPNSDLAIELNININKINSLISLNNTSEVQNVNFNVIYKIIDRVNNNIIEENRIVIIDGIKISDNRFSNFATDKYIIKNFSRSISIRLENKVQLFLNNKKCKIN